MPPTNAVQSAQARHRVFISHSHMDGPLVEGRLLPLLERHGIDVWYAAREIRTADEWERTIRKGLEECQFLLVVMSPQSAGSKWVRAEVAWALDHHRAIIPLMIEPCRAEDFHLRLPQIQHLDFRTDADQEEAGHKLLAVAGLAARTAVSVTESPSVEEDVDEEEEELPLDSSASGGVGLLVDTTLRPVDLIIDRDFGSYPMEEQKALVRAIGHLLHLSRPIRILRKRPGSVRLTIELTAEEAESLLEAVDRGELEEFGVVSVDGGPGVFSKIFADEETLVTDDRAGLTPSQQVEQKLIGMLKASPLLVSHVQRRLKPGPR